MTSVNITVAGASAVATMNGVITTGMVGASAAFSFDATWDGLTKVAVFRAGSVTKAVPLVTDTSVIPWEVLLTPYVKLYIGVYGTMGEDIVIPTVWVACTTIQPGADPEADPCADPTLPVWGQILNRLEQLEASGGGNGDIDPEAIDAAVKEYLEENPVSVDPESIGVIPAPVVAEVGQTIVVKAVDESGKPAEWEAADRGDVWEEIASGELTEEVTSIYITKGNDGKAFSLRRGILCLHVAGTATNTADRGSLRFRHNANTAATGSSITVEAMTRNNPYYTASATGIYECTSAGSMVDYKGNQDIVTARHYAISDAMKMVTALYIDGITENSKYIGVGTKWVLMGVRA